MKKNVLTIVILFFSGSLIVSSAFAESDSNNSTLRNSRDSLTIIDPNANTAPEPPSTVEPDVTPNPVEPVAISNPVMPVDTNHDPSNSNDSANTNDPNQAKNIRRDRRFRRELRRRQLHRQHVRLKKQRQRMRVQRQRLRQQRHRLRHQRRIRQRRIRQQRLRLRKQRRHLEHKRRHQNRKKYRKPTHGKNKHNQDDLDIPRVSTTELQCRDGRTVTFKSYRENGRRIACRHIMKHGKRNVWLKVCGQKMAGKLACRE